MMEFTVILVDRRRQATNQTIAKAHFVRDKAICDLHCVLPVEVIDRITDHPADFEVQIVGGYTAKIIQALRYPCTANELVICIDLPESFWDTMKREREEEAERRMISSHSTARAVERSDDLGGFSSYFTF